MSEASYIETELNELAVLIGRLQRRELTRPEFRSQSVHLGVYTQRQEDRYFVRIRVPLGMLTATQLQALADSADRWADGECHFTTRQGVEIHNLSLDGTLESLAVLAKAGLTSHESGGNTVRNILVCPHAIDEENDLFDTTEYAALLNACFLRHPDFQSLPRKIKIGFSSCAEDCTHTTLQDLGFQARTSAAGLRGFRVMVGGGTGALPRLGKELLEFLPATELLLFTESFLRMFNRLGDRQNRRRSRVKFLLESLGLERLRAEVMAEWKALKATQKKPLSAEQSAKPLAAEAPRQTLRLALHGGNIKSDQLRRLASFMGQYALTLRVTPEQELLLRDIRLEELPRIRAALREAVLVPRNAGLHLTACPGSTVCSNAFTNSQGLAEALSRKLLDVLKSGSGEPLRIRISGCTNGCALHAIAEIGLEGLAQRRDGALIPSYRLWIGGQEHQQEPRLATDLGIIPARRAADCVSNLMLRYQRECHPSESFAAVLGRIGIEPFAAIAKQHQETGSPDEIMMDVGDEAPYRTQESAPSTTC